jgi:hypothetical protein
VAFTSSPHIRAPLEQWKVHLRNLQREDQRKPFIAMAIRRAKQHIELITRPKKELPDEREEMQGLEKGVEEPAEHSTRHVEG